MDSNILNTDVDYDGLDREQLIALAKERRQYVIEIAAEARWLAQRMTDVNVDARSTAAATEFQYADILVKNGNQARRLELHEQLQESYEWQNNALRKLLQITLEKDTQDD